MNSSALMMTTASKLRSANGNACPLACAAITEIPSALYERTTAAPREWTSMPTSLRA
jgi:hypothetical protein